MSRSSPAIMVEGLGKRYTLGRRVDPYRTLGDTLAETLGRLRGALRGRGSRPGVEDFWALRDVSFNVAHGEAIGIVGGNGAGKSTLLKVLSRITSPTTGRAQVRGRLGSLLEVGTGFHPDLTGRENVFLNGAILGMRRAEIVARFDEIVAFAEVERFIDTPVKRYSSGMYLRLAFSVAAHLEPDVLVVDEVLAVGDAAFQRKCLGKMGDVTAHGRTVLFVSHNMDAVQRLCGRAILLERGKVAAEGTAQEVTAQYLLNASAHTAPNVDIDVSSTPRVGSGAARFTHVRYRNPADEVAGHVFPSVPLELTLGITASRAMDVMSLAVVVYDLSGRKLLNADTIALGQTIALGEGSNVLRFWIEAIHLLPGTYVVGLWLADGFGSPFDFIERAFELAVLPEGVDAMGGTPQHNGVVACRYRAERISAPVRHESIPPDVAPFSLAVLESSRRYP